MCSENLKDRLKKISLHLRLSLLFTGLLSLVLILLVIGLNAIFNFGINTVLNEHLQITAIQVLNSLRVDESGDITYASDAFSFTEGYFFQVWSQDGQLLLSSEGAADLPTDDHSYQTTYNQGFFETVKNDDIRYRVSVNPFKINGTEHGWLRVGRTIGEIRSQQLRFWIISGFFCLFAIVIAGIASWFTIQYVLRPLTDISQIVQQITTTDDFSKRIPVRSESNDIIDELILTFNKTLDRLEGLINIERRFMAYVSHELRTPLTVIKGNVGLMRIMNAVDHESLNSIETEVDRLTRLVTDLLLIEQTEMGDSKLLKKPVEIDDLLMEVFKELKVLSGDAHDVQIVNIEPATVRGVRDRLKQVLLNLGSNAINYSPKGGKVSLGLKVESRWVRISVSDEGIGIPQDDLDLLFERFFRGKNAYTLPKKNVGFGLGLAIANSIVKNHGGHIEVQSVVGEGTTFVVWLPLSISDVPTRPIELLERE